jgi:hypothetical protein
MLVNNKGFASPEIERLIREVIEDDNRFEKELRSVHRERLVLPVEIKRGTGEEYVRAFSRNISSEGIALISDLPFEDGERATLTIHQTAKPGSRVVSKCRWCKPFGKNFWVSGWQFMHVPRT